MSVSSRMLRSRLDNLSFFAVKQKLYMIRNFTIRVLIILAAAASIILVVAVSLYRSVEFDPSLLSKDLSQGRGTIFTDRFGRELRFIPDLRGERARWVPIAEIPATVTNAFIAAEDKRFYQHHGFDPAAIARAAWNNLAKGKIASGASTISQQVVRLSYSDAADGSIKSGKKRQYRDKLIEIVRSIKMERIFSKREILEQYLNRVPMGNNLTGVGTAARAYFGMPLGNLSISEAALLASLPKAPGILNPYGSGYDRLIERRNWVLARMEKLGYISRDQYLLAREEKNRLRKLEFVSAAPHVVDMLLKEGAAGKGRVRTTIDLDLQQRVQEILASHAERLRHRGATQAAAIVIHNPSMDVLASAGSIEYSDRNGGFNNGVQAFRSAGSALKPFLYALAVESGETVATLLSDTEQKFRSREGQYSPLNFDRKEYGPVTMRSALGNSLNLSAVKMLDRLGEDRFYEMLSRLNLINHPEHGPEHYGLGMAIGNPEVSPEQLAAAFAMFANRGVYRPVHYVFENREKRKTDARYLILPQTAYIITDILSDPTARILTFNRSRLMTDFPFKVAIKTGTSTFYRDLWAVGYTPDYTVAVWVGNFDGSPTNNLSGSSAAVPIFADIMTWLYRQSDPTPFRRPKGIEHVTVCGYSGMKPSPYCDHTVEELFIAGTEPRTVCTFHTADSRRHELAPAYAGWLYDKNRRDSAGRFKLSGFGNNLSAVFQDPWEGVNQDREPGVRTRNAFLSISKKTTDSIPPQQTHYRIGETSPASPVTVSDTAGAEVKIIYPLDHDSFVVNQYENNQMIKLQAIVGRPVAYVDWYMNGSLYKRTGPPYQAYWPLEKGRYRITAVTPSNRGDSVGVTVE